MHPALIQSLLSRGVGDGLGEAFQLQRPRGLTERLWGGACVAAACLQLVSAFWEPWKGRESARGMLSSS